jgi:hypothetical protein
MLRSRNFSAQWLSLVLLGTQVGVAQAQTPACQGPASAVATELAKSAFREGQTAFNEGDYARAVDQLQLAYTRDCTAHAILLNLATAQELAGTPADAIRSLELYNERVPGSSYQEPNRRRIERLQRMLSKPAAPAPAPVASAAPAPVPTAAPIASSPPVVPIAPPVPAPVAVPPAPRATLGAAAVVEPPRESASAEDSRSLLPLGVAAVGAAASLIGGIVYVSAVAASGSAADRCGGPRSACADAQAVADGEAARARAQTAGWITGVGVVTAVGGVVWYLVQPTTSARSSSGWRWDAHMSTSAAAISASRSF